MNDEAISQPLGLADRLQARTADLHRRAERTGIMQDLLRGRAERQDYTLLLANLLPVYEALDSAFARLAPGSPACVLARPELFRAPALRADLIALAGEPGPQLPAAHHYAARIQAAGGGVLLAAHGYVRYLGDLYGGQILKRRLEVGLALRADQLRFYAFPAVADPPVFAREIRDALNRIVLDPACAEQVLGEAETAFALNIDLFEAVGAEIRRRAA